LADCQALSPPGTGTDEHTDEVARRYPPKGADLREVTDGQVREAPDIMDTCPRKILGCRTPAEVFHKARPP